MLPGITYLVPWYILLTMAGLVGTYFSLITSHLVITMPMVIWIMISFFENVPVELEESARVDGLTHIGAFLRIVLPLSRPGIATSALLSFIFSWNQLLFSMVLGASQKKTLPVALFDFNRLCVHQLGRTDGSRSPHDAPRRHLLPLCPEAHRRRPFRRSDEGLTTSESRKSDMFDVEQLSINTVRMLAMDMVSRAGSGHYGFPLGATTTLHTLFARHLKFDPTNPHWASRDRFILSAGHGSAMLYSMLHVAGFDLQRQDLEAFRKHGSRTPGHPERGETPGVEVTTGPLGQGVANAVGLAIAEEYLRGRPLAARLGTIERGFWPLTEILMEGVSHRAQSPWQDACGCRGCASSTTTTTWSSTGGPVGSSTRRALTASSQAWDGM